MFGEVQSLDGLIGARVGCFEHTDGGMLLLNEVGYMPVALQSKLLRVLQEQGVGRVCGQSPIPINVRLIASTHRDLQAGMRTGTIREDRYYRLAVFPIDVPPLRDQRENIPLVAEHFREKHAERLGVFVPTVSATVLLVGHDWPGTFASRRTSSAEASCWRPRTCLRRPRFPGSWCHQPRPGTLADVGRQVIANAVKRSGQNLTDTARALGINRSTLHRKLERHGLRERSI